MSSLYITTIVGHVAQIGVALTVITNTFLIYLTMHHVKHISFAYRVMISIQVCIGVIFSLSDLLSRPFVHSYNASFIYFTSSNMFGALIWSRLLLFAYAAIYQNIFCFIAIQFIYRHFLIKGSINKLMWFEGIRILFWAGYITMFSVIWVVLLIPSLPDFYSREYVKEEMEANYGIPIENVAGFFVLVYEPKTNLKTWRIQGLVTIFGFSTVVCCHYAVIIYCSLQIHSKIKELSSITSSKSHQLQYQLFLTLILQIAAPSIFYNIPAIAVYYVPFLNLKLSFPTGIVIASFSVYPSVDSFILMCVVNEYKKAIRQLIHQLLGRCKSEPSNNLQQQNQRHINGIDSIRS